jgi:hypothetical protein
MRLAGYCLWLTLDELCYDEITMWENTAARSRKGRIIGLLLAIALLLSAGGIVTCQMVERHNRSPFPETIHDATNLTLFYPTTLPKGYVVDQTSVKRTNGVINYVATDNNKHYINFSLQARADKFDFNTFYSTTLSKAFKFTTPYGEATVGTMSSSGNSVGSLINGSTWIIISAARVSPEDIQTVISKLKTY